MSIWYAKELPPCLLQAECFALKSIAVNFHTYCKNKGYICELCYQLIKISSTGSEEKNVPWGFTTEDTLLCVLSFAEHQPHYIKH